MKKILLTSFFLILTLSLVLAQNDSRNKSDQGIGQDLNEQIAERRAEIKEGNYNDSLGRLLNVRILAENLRELRVNNVAARTDLKLVTETDNQGRAKIKTTLKNGREAEIKIMPDTASERALERLRLKVCSIDNNCTITLKDVGSGDNEKVLYEVQIERHSKILGIFQKKMQVRADIDAETGNIDRVRKPWWAFIATEPSE